ncbi:MAG: hypothetical protein MJB14_15970 [Spirochaetes bacterium]|nr:hypothetical protein [Spirochaetota bacterium]
MEKIITVNDKGIIRKITTKTSYNDIIAVALVLIYIPLEKKNCIIKKS